MDLFVLAAVAVLAAMAGFWCGRSLRWQVTEGIAEEDMEEEDGGYRAEVQERKSRSGNHRTGARSQSRITLGQVIGSPASGTLTGSMEEGRQTVHIHPEQGKVYAPASGRITRLYPMGSMIKMQTEFGAELLIQAGSHVDEMHSDLYRCRVMEHEIVGKGKLLLEYDVEELQAEGAGVDVTMSVENEEAVNVIVAGDMQVRAGEEVMWVKDRSAARRD